MDERGCVDGLMEAFLRDAHRRETLHESVAEPLGT
jgi:hypothetical protein